MKTKIINLKQFRQNITKLWKEARKENIRFIVMHHSTPILEVLPYKDEYLTFDDENQHTKNVHKTEKKAEIKEKREKIQQNPKPSWPKAKNNEHKAENKMWYRKYI